MDRRSQNRSETARPVGRFRLFEWARPSARASREEPPSTLLARSTLPTWASMSPTILKMAPPPHAARIRRRSPGGATLCIVRPKRCDKHELQEFRQCKEWHLRRTCSTRSEHPNVTDRWGECGRKIRNPKSEIRIQKSVLPLRHEDIRLPRVGVVPVGAEDKCRPVGRPHREAVKALGERDAFQVLA